jgi:hypothetical protein
MSKHAKWIAGDEHTLWVSSLGAYGTSELLVVDTRHWTQNDFQELENAADADKQYIAQEITKARAKDYKWAVRELIESGTIQVKVFRMDEDGVAEVDLDGNDK